MAKILKFETLTIDLQQMIIPSLTIVVPLHSMAIKILIIPKYSLKDTKVRRLVVANGENYLF